MWGFSSTGSTTALAGGCRKSPAISAALDANSGSVLMHQERRRHLLTVALRHPNRFATSLPASPVDANKIKRARKTCRCSAVEDRTRRSSVTFSSRVNATGLDPIRTKTQQITRTTNSWVLAHLEVDQQTENEKQNRSHIQSPNDPAVHIFAPKQLVFAAGRLKA